MQENSMRPYGDTLIPVIPIEQEADIRHGQDHPFCFADPTCPCHEDPTLIAVVAEQVANGLLTPTEATRTVKGEML